MLSISTIMWTEHSKYPSARKLKPHQNCFDMHSYGNDSPPPRPFLFISMAALMTVSPVSAAAASNQASFRSPPPFRVNEGEQGALDEEWSAGLVLHQLLVAVGLVITHIIGH